MPVCGSPRLFAACHVLLRLLLPRHSPCALFYLTFENSCSNLTFARDDCILPQSDFIATFRVCFHTLHNLVFLHLLFPSYPYDVCCFSIQFSRYILVGSSGVEPPTSRLSGARSNHLSYEPMLWFSVSQELPMVEMNRLELSTPCLQSRCSSI